MLFRSFSKDAFFLKHLYLHGCLCMLVDDYQLWVLGLGHSGIPLITMSNLLSYQITLGCIVMLKGGKSWLGHGVRSALPLRPVTFWRKLLTAVTSRFATLTTANTKITWRWSITWLIQNFSRYLLHTRFHSKYIFSNIYKFFITYSF